MARDSFIFYRSFYEAIKEIPPEDQLQVYKAISIYALEQKEISLTGIARAIFSLVKPQLDANYKKYENGKQKKSKTEANNKQKESKSETNVNVNDNVNVNENDNNNNVGESCVDGLQDVINFYNNNVGSLTPYGLKLIEDYISELGKDVVIYAMQISVEADKRTMQYIKAILNNWSKKGIKTLVEAKKESSLGRKNKEKEDEKIEGISELYEN